jgi:hypothetical protein
MSAHTPGPWEWDGKFTVTIPHRDGWTAFRTNPEDARLIAAAPELLNAAQAAYHALEKLRARECRAGIGAQRRALARSGHRESRGPVMSVIDCQLRADTLHAAAHEQHPCIERARRVALQSRHSRANNFRAEPRGIHR